MKILIATTQVPFCRGGAEMLVENLKEALLFAGHEVEVVAIPFKWYPPEKILDQMLACRLLDVTQSNGADIDLLIGMKFPAYLIPHPNKVLWIMHQHRTAYELYDHPLCDLVNFPNGAQVRDAIKTADTKLIPEARAVFTISQNVSSRLKNACGISSTPLYNPPPEAKEYYSRPAKDYFFFPSRLCETKRQSLVIEALAKTSLPVKVFFAGLPDRPAYAEKLKKRAHALGLENRVRWLNNLSNEEKRKYYAECLATVFPPIDEDYGYVTLEAMLAGKAVITTRDAGGPLEFVKDGETGRIAHADAQSLADAMDEAWSCREETIRWGKAGRDHYASMNISWPSVIEQLLE